MAYTTPITDRGLADITAQNSKAFFNVADWTRVYGNSLEVNTLLATNIYTLSFDTLTTPTTANIPTVSEINTMLSNIERMRLWASIYLSDYITDPLFVEIKDDWLAGQSNTAPNYINVNSWEKVLDLLNDYLDPFTPPTLSGNLLSLTTGGDFEMINGSPFELIG